MGCSRDRTGQDMNSGLLLTNPLCSKLPHLAAAGFTNGSTHHHNFPKFYQRQNFVSAVSHTHRPAAAAPTAASAGSSVSLPRTEAMGLKRHRPTAMNLLSSLALLAGTAAAAADESASQRLAVIVPAHAGDLSRAVSALDRWPQACSPVTQQNVDLVLYYAEGEDDSGPSEALEGIAAGAGRCFESTKLVYANLNEEVSLRKSAIRWRRSRNRACRTENKI